MSNGTNGGSRSLSSWRFRLIWTKPTIRIDSPAGNCYSCADPLCRTGSRKPATIESIIWMGQPRVGHAGAASLHQLRLTASISHSVHRFPPMHCLVRSDLARRGSTAGPISFRIGRLEDERLPYQLLIGQGAVIEPLENRPVLGRICEARESVLAL